MAIGKVSGVRLIGVASAVPEKKVTLDDLANNIGEENARKFSNRTGINSRHVASDKLCASDLCFAAARELFKSLNWSPDSIDLLIFVSQTPDYLLPATSCSLHERLGLSKHCAAFDVNLGCSGYVYGFWIASQFIVSGSARRVLLLVGDTISRIVSPQDLSVAPLFGDAGTATAIEADKDAADMFFNLGTDGSGQKHLIVPAGAFRQPHDGVTAHRKKDVDGNIRSDEDLFMDGAEVFTFTLRELPSLIKSVIEMADWEIDAVDAYVMHQANRFMLEYLTKRMRLPSEKVVLAMEEYGNTSLASIPLAMTHALADKLSKDEKRLILAGFGVGFSWGAVALSCSSLVMPKLQLVADNDVLT
jgi:3-oxoacyl-[acyl-carrier-protein] synthase III